MTAVCSHFLITPEAAVQKFLIDMRLTAERSYRGWRQALEDGLGGTSLAPADRAELLKPHPLSDYFYAGLIGLQAVAIRESFTPTVAEALLRQVALQVDDAAGREDRMVSNMVFIIFGRIRKNIELGLHARPEDVATDVILERLSIDRMATTRHLMLVPHYRHALSAPLAARPNWWKAFQDLYTVDVLPRMPAWRPLSRALQALACRRAKRHFFTRLSQAPPPPLPAFAVRLGRWLMPRPHAH